MKKKLSRSVMNDVKDPTEQQTLCASPQNITNIRSLSFHPPTFSALSLSRTTPPKESP